MIFFRGFDGQLQRVLTVACAGAGATDISAGVPAGAAEGSLAASNRPAWAQDPGPLGPWALACISVACLGAGLPGS